jgi:lipoate-protein ligase A
VNHVFSTLSLWVDPVPRDGPQQMACDEALLHLATTPLLRVFRWNAPWVSIGYFMQTEEAARARADLPFCRRWTGGGAVVHDGDFTFSLIVPRSEKWCLQRAATTYAELHQALASALCRIGKNVRLADRDESSPGQCFVGPVRHDLISEGRKIAGGAQRRTRQGLLHQGSLQLDNLPADFPRFLAEALAARVETWTSQPDNLAAHISELCRAKYGRENFLYRDRP